MTNSEFVGWPFPDELGFVPAMNALISAAIKQIDASGNLPTDWREFLAETLDSDLWQCEPFVCPSNFAEWNYFAKRFATAIAIMSYWPGGVTFFGWRYLSKLDA